MSFWDEKEAKKLFKEPPCYNASIEKPYIKRLNNINLLQELPFYDELNIIKTSKAFKDYVKSYSIEIINSKGPSIRFKISKSSIKGFFKHFLDEVKGFKCQMTLRVLLNKYKENTDREFTTVYFNSTTKTVIDSKYDLDK